MVLGRQFALLTVVRKPKVMPELLGAMRLLLEPVSRRTG